MKHLYFLRHGQSEANALGVMAGWTDAPLTILGNEQAMDAAQRLRNLNLGHPVLLDAILSSDLVRAKDTATPLAKAFGLKMVELEGLREVNLGAWENLSFTQIKAMNPDAVSKWMSEGMSFTYPQGESLRDAVTRATRVIEVFETQGSDPLTSLMIVAHGGLIGGLIAHYVFGDALLASHLNIENAKFSRVTFYNEFPWHTHSHGVLDLLNL